MSTVFAACLRTSEYGHTAIFHYSAYIGKVNIDMKCFSDDFSNTFGCNGQNIIGMTKGITNL